MDDKLQAQLQEVLHEYGKSWLGLDLAGSATLSQMEQSGSQWNVTMTLGFPAERAAQSLVGTLTPLFEAATGLSPIQLTINSRIAAHAVQAQLKPLAGVKNVIAVASGKGGVGKSTTAVNLALALAANGAAVGLLDADIYGPSIPQMLGLAGQKPTSEDGKTLTPLSAHGIRAMSIGFLIDEEQPMVWRGPMVTQALTQLINDSLWGELDYLIVDMPPGTGDTQLTLSQRVPLSGAVIVTTPQDIALLDARKGLKMFRKVSVPVLGIIENMSTHVCSACGHEESIFGSGGGAAMAAQYEVPLLGSVPLDREVRERVDAGQPSVASDPDGSIAQRYHEIALRMGAQLAQSRKDYTHLFPKISIEDR